MARAARSHRSALYTSNDDAVAEVSKAGALTLTGRGLTSIMVRYSGQVAAVRVAAPLEGPGMRRGRIPGGELD